MSNWLLFLLVVLVELVLVDALDAWRVAYPNDFGPNALFWLVVAAFVVVDFLYFVMLALDSVVRY